MTDTIHEDEELDLRLRLHHKKVFTGILLPTVFTMTVFIVVTHWRLDSKFYFGLAALAFIVVFNSSLTVKRRVVETRWGSIDSRSDRLDTIRWCVNFPMDVFMFWCFEMSVGAMVVAWTILTFGAITEVYAQRNRVITAGFAIAGYITLITYVQPTSINAQIFLFTCYVSLIYIFWRFEYLLTKDTREYFREKLYREKIQAQSQALARDAAVGKTVRSLTHELQNLSAVASLSVSHLKNETREKEDSIKRLERSLELMTRMSCLVLDDLGGYCAKIQSTHLSQTQEDVELLLGGLIKHFPIELSVNFPSEIEDISYVERSGASYLILHNLVVNARQAIEEKFSEESGGEIALVVTVDDKYICFEVGDNGVGIHPDSIQSVLNGTAESTKRNGHGLGMGFVATECDENCFELGVESMRGVGTTFTITVPRN